MTDLYKWLMKYALIQPSGIFSFSRKYFFLLFLVFNSALSFCQPPDSWTKKSDLGVAVLSNREFALGMEINGKGYIGAGYNGVSGDLYSWWQYDPASDSWTQKADYDIGGTIAARRRLVGWSINGKGYMGTGMNGGAPFQSWMEYDPIANSWATKANFGGGGRYSAAGFTIGNKGYVGTGNDGSSGRNDVYEFDPANGPNGTWTLKTSFAGASRWSAVGFSIGNYGYIGSGYSTSYTKDFWRYNPGTNSWSQIANLSGSGRALASSFVLNNKGFVVCGSNSGPPLSDLWEYNPATNQWIQRASIPVARYGAASFVIGNHAYVGTGIDGSGNDLRDLWEYTPATQAVPTVFQKTYGGTNFDTDTTANISYACPTADGGYIISSTTKSFGNGGSDAYLIKTDVNGIILWQKTFGTTGNETAASATQTNDGGYIVAGATRKSTSDEDMLILKITSSGNLQWSRSLGGTQISRANYAEETQAGGEYLIVGRGEGNGNNTCLVKLDAVGGQQLARNINVTSAGDEGFSLEQTLAGNYAIGAQITIGPNTDAYVPVLNPSGGTLTPNFFHYDSPGGGADLRAIIRQTPDGGFLLCGSTNSTPASHGGFDFYLVKVTNGLALSWARVYGGVNDDFGRSLAITFDGRYAVGGYTKSFGNGTDAFLALINTNGSVAWSKTYGGVAVDKANSVYPTADGGFILCGETYSFPSPSSFSNIYLVKTDSVGNAGCNDSTISLSPNSLIFNSPNVSASTSIYTIITNNPAATTPSQPESKLCTSCSFPIGKSKTNVKCFGTSTGTAQVGAVGGAIPYTYSWSNGATTSSVTGLAAGTYTVTVIDANSCSATDTLKIFQPPVLALGFPADTVNICKGRTDTLTPAPSGGTPPYSYAWAPQAGLSCTTCSNPAASPTGSTLYVLTLTDMNSCALKDSVNVVVHAVPSANAGPDQTICSGTSVGIGSTPGNGVDYLWSPAAGLNNTTIANPNANPTGNTTYIVVASNALGCSSSDTVDISVVSTSTVSISASTAVTICMGTSSILTATSNTPNYSWSTGATVSTITVTPTAVTGYTVTVGSGSCAATSSMQLYPVPTPTASITSSSTGSTVCKGTAVVLTGAGGGNYSWNTGATSASVTVATTAAGTYVNTLTVTAGGNLSCYDIESYTLTVVNAPTINITATSYTLCTGISSDTLIATNLTGATYVWGPGPPPFPNNDTVIIGPNLSQGNHTYTVSVSNGLGCAGTASVTINVGAGYPTPLVSPNPADYCFGNPLQPFTCTNPVAFVGWTDLQGNPLQLGNSYTPTVTAVNTYTFLCVQGSGKYCLSLPAVVTLNIHALPVASAGADVSICPGHTTQLQAGGGINYLWSPVTSLSSSTVSNPASDPDSSISYQVFVTDAYGCKDKDSITVYIAFNDTCGIHIFNVLTPNSDGKNDGWLIDGITLFPDNSVTIFNRWGTKVWGGEKYDNVKVVWHGENEQGEPLPAGTYYYVIKAKGKNYSKWVELLR